MRTVRRARIADFGVPYTHPQAVPFEDRIPWILDREFFVGGPPPSSWWKEPAWRHLGALLLLIAILLVVIYGTGGHVEVFSR